MAPIDHTTQANAADISIVHSDYELDVEFTTKLIDGIAKLKFVAKTEGISSVVLDTRDLKVHFIYSVSDDKDKEFLEYVLAEPDKVMGSKLSITLPQPLSAGEAATVTVRFTTGPNASALQFLDPAQTAGGRHPYLFTQCQAIHARSLVPCQDSPGVKMTYTAAVRVPEALTAVMGAIGTPKPASKLELIGSAKPGTKCYYFKQDVPIPSYLLALAVGELESRSLGPRCAVWSEPSMVEAGAYEFADTEAFLTAGEEVAGEYLWGRYDLLLLPPSFPYGGMENPCLTFVTPTLLAGDRSLVNVVAHEIAHSWTGNLVTNASWADFWLNEGWTVFLERKIVGRLRGEKTLQFQAAMGYLQLQDTVAQFGAGHPFTALVLDLAGGVDPDDAYSKVAYEKGSYFLFYLQGLVGGPGAFEPFMRAYIQRFKFQTVTSEGFKAFFLDHFKDVPAVSDVDWNTWLYAPGLPPVRNEYDESLGQAAVALAKRWHTSDVMGVGSNGPAGASPQDIEGWSADQLVAFLDNLAQLRALQPLNKRVTRRMAELYGLDASRNSEVRGSWYRLCLNAGDEDILPLVAAFLKEQGRMKFLKPLYRALYSSPQGRQLALDTFEEAKGSYHPIAVKVVAGCLQG